MKAALEQLGAHVTVISRSGPDNYTNLDRHADAEMIANTTPVGMYPHNGSAAVDLKQFPCCQGVLDIVYNPVRTALILQAEELGIPNQILTSVYFICMENVNVLWEQLTNAYGEQDASAPAPAENGEASEESK